MELRYIFKDGKKILQFRTSSIHYDGGNHPTGYIWSEWQVVPLAEDNND